MQIAIRHIATAYDVLALSVESALKADDPTLTTAILRTGKERFVQEFSLAFERIIALCDERRPE